MSVRISSVVPASSTDDDDGDSVNGNLLNVIHFPFALSLRSPLDPFSPSESIAFSLSLSRCRQTTTHGEKNDFPTKHTQGFLQGAMLLGRLLGRWFQKAD